MFVVVIDEEGHLAKRMGSGGYEGPPAQFASGEAEKKEPRARTEQGALAEEDSHSAKSRQTVYQNRHATNCYLIFYSSFYIYVPSPSLCFKFPGHRNHASPFIPLKETM